MGILDSKQWVADINETMAACPSISRLEGAKVLVTGASGLICSAIVDLLGIYNTNHRQQIHILAAGRNEEKIRFRFASWLDEPWFSFVPYEATKSNVTFESSADYIIHGAGNASPCAVMENPVETMNANFDGMRGLLEYARECEALRVLYISSSEVYGRKEGIAPYAENEYGVVDLLNPRNAYAMGKRATETLCVSYAAEYGVETVIVRPGHIYGPTASPEDGRVSSAWAYAAARGKDIVMKSDGSQLRSYCYCLDCASAILFVLLNGEAHKAYNISNPASILSIKEMGNILAEAGNVKVIHREPNNKEKMGFNLMENSSLNSEYLEALGWRGLFDAERGLAHTVNILRDL